MRIRVAVLLFTIVAVLAGCDENSPTAPPDLTVADTSGQIYGTVFITGSGGKCLPGATIEINSGSATGKRVQQTAEQCASGDAGAGRGYRLTGLDPRRTVRVVATAPGYFPQERSAQVQPEGASGDNVAVDFELFSSSDASLAFIFGTVWGKSGCLTGARVEVLDGSAAGQVFVQSLLGCSDNDGSGNSYFLRNLPHGTPIRIRASAPGYESQERVVEPPPPGFRGPFFSVDFTLLQSFP